jgi:hypothetical protein
MAGVVDVTLLVACELCRSELLSWFATRLPNEMCMQIKLDRRSGKVIIIDLQEEGRCFARQKLVL